MLSENFGDDSAAAVAALSKIERDWDGKRSILRLKDADYNWRQMEWWAFYFEWLCRKSLVEHGFSIPGERFGSTTFDASRSLNWDFKAHAIKSNSHKAILNDVDATDASIAKNGSHGVLVALCDVIYNDTDRSFQKWHTELKGGHSEYERRRIARTAVSRYRKTHASLVEILMIEIDASSAADLSLYRQGQNSNGRPRPPKYMIDLEDLPESQIIKMEF